MIELTSVIKKGKCGNMKKLKILSNFDLKILGIVLMVGDHIFDAFVNQGAPEILTILGRSVAPIFIFLTVEGYHYTRSKSRYMMNLLSFFWITTFAINVVTKLVPNDNLVLINSMMGTLFLGVLAMWAWDSMFVYKTDRKRFLLGLSAWAFIIIMPLICAMILSTYNVALINLIMYIPNVITVEGGLAFVILALLLHIFRKNRYLQCAVILVLSALCLLTGNVIQSWMVLSILLILMYNGEKGRSMKWFFYIFYPSHIIIIYLLATFINH